MKTVILSSFIVLFITVKAEAQTFNWLRTVNVDYEYNPEMISYNTCANPQGGCYFYGIQEHISFYNRSMGVLFLKKYSQDGTESWSRTIGGESEITGMVCAENGDVYISGHLLDDADFWGEDTLVKTGLGTDGFIARVSAEGDLAWCVNMTGLPMGEGTVTELALHSDMLFVAYSNWMNTYVLIYSPDGEYLDSIVQEDVSIISGIDFDQEGNLFATGGCAGWQATFAGVPYPAPFSYTTYLVKYNSSFEPEWVKYIEDITCTFPQVRVDEEGWVYFSGQLWDETHFDTITANGPAWSYDFFLARLSPDGQYQWVCECPEVITGDATIGRMHFLDTDNEGNALLTGITRGILDWGNGVVSDVTGNYQDLIIWNYAPDGQVNWIKTAGGEWYELSHSISAGSDGVAYLAGVISGSVVFDTIIHDSDDFLDPFLAKLDPGILSGTSENLFNDEMLVYPNPVREKLFFHSNAVYSHYMLYNSMGHLVQSGKISGNNPGISIEGLPPGFYLIILEGEEPLSGFARVIVK
jgi:hypothetical protein